MPKLCAVSPDGTAVRRLTPEQELSIGVAADSDTRYGVGPAAPVWAGDGYIYALAAAEGRSNIYCVPAGGGEFAPVSRLPESVYAFSLDRSGRKGALAAGRALMPGEISAWIFPTGRR